MKKLLTLLFLLVMSFSLTGCAEWDSWSNDLKGDITGNEYYVDVFDNQGHLQARMSGQNIGIDSNRIKTVRYNSDGGLSYGYELSSVISLTVDGAEVESCGDTLIFYDKRLTPDVMFNPDFSFTSESESILDWHMFAAPINSLKNSFGKERVVLIKSQLGNPIYAFSGKEVYWEIPDDLPKFTKLMIDGKAVYIHRSNFQIIDKSLLQ